MSDNDIPIIGAKPAGDEPMVEVCRSFSYKLNLENHGGPRFENADFFASRKIQCAQSAVKWVSQEIFEECVLEVRQAVAAFKAEMLRKRALKVARPVHPAAVANARAFEQKQQKELDNGTDEAIEF